MVKFPTRILVRPATPVALISDFLRHAKRRDEQSHGLQYDVAGFARIREFLQGPSVTGLIALTSLTTDSIRCC